MSQISQIDTVINEGMQMDHILRPKQQPQFPQKCGNLVKIEVDVLASNGCVPDFFQLILKIYIKIDF